MKILTISDSPNMFSGLARVHRHVIDAAVDRGHMVLPCVWYGYDYNTLQQIQARQITPPPIYYETQGQQIQMLSLYKRRKNEDIKAIYEIIKTAKPDIVCTIGDYWDFFYMQALKIKTEFSFKWVAYLTMETDEVDTAMKPLFNYADVLVAPTEYGKRIIESETGRPAQVLPYGVDKQFVRMTDAQRDTLRGERGCEDKIRFITVAQNTSRKNLPALIQAVGLIAHRDPQKKMQFYVHTNLEGVDPQEQSLYDLRSLTRKFGVEDWFVFPEDCTSLFSAPADRLLVDEYNSSDFFITPSICEGYGLPIQEAMACGLPVIANGASCMTEHLGKVSSGTSFGLSERGWSVANRMEIKPPDQIIKVPRQDALGQAIWEMVQIHKNPKEADLLSGMRENCMRYAKERQWADMKRGICEIFESVSGPVSIPVEVI